MKINITSGSIDDGNNDNNGDDNGNDIFVYEVGSRKDTITDYASGQNKISITGAKISKTSISGSDVILTVGSGSIKVKGAKGKKLSIYNNSSSIINTVITDGGDVTIPIPSTTVTLDNSDSLLYTAASTIKNIIAPSRTKAIKIAGNSKANSILGSSAADSLNVEAILILSTVVKARI